MVNVGSAELEDRRIALPQDAPSGLSLSYHATDPRTKTTTATPGTSAAIVSDDGT